MRAHLRLWYSSQPELDLVLHWLPFEALGSPRMVPSSISCPLILRWKDGRSSSAIGYPSDYSFDDVQLPSHPNFSKLILGRRLALVDVVFVRRLTGNAIGGVFGKEGTAWGGATCPRICSACPS